LKIAFFQFLTSSRTPFETLRDFWKRKVVGGASITGATLASALGRPMHGAWGPESLDSVRFDMAAISFNTPGAPRAYREALRLKARGKIAIAGGPHPSVLSDEALKYFDSVCVGPGETQFPRMVADAEHGRLKRVYRGRPGDWTVPWRKMTRGLSLVQLSRGCQNGCPFCIVSTLFPGGIDEKPLDLVERELEHTTGSLSIIDDNFPSNTKRGQEILALLKDSGKKFICQVSPETALGRNFLQNLALAGCTLVGVGIESINTKSLAFLGKTPLKDPEEIVWRIHDAGMACYLNIIFGSDGETPAIFEQTLRFLEKVHPEVVSPHILTPLPGTRLRDALAAKGRLMFDRDALPEAWVLFDSKHVTFIPEPMTPAELADGFSIFSKELFSLSNTLKRSPKKHLGISLLSSMLKNAW